MQKDSISFNTKYKLKPFHSLLQRCITDNCESISISVLVSITTKEYTNSLFSMKKKPEKIKHL